MPTSRITLSGQLVSGIEELAAEGAVSLSTNVWVDQAGAIRARPGITTWQTGHSLGTANIIGATGYDPLKGILFVTDDRKIWFYTPDDGLTVALSDSTDASKLDGTGRPVFAVTEVGFIIIGGGAPQHVDRYNAVSHRLSDDSTGPTRHPPSGTHICELGRRLVINKAGRLGEFYHSGSELGEPGTAHYANWPPDFVDYADSRPDALQAAYATDNHIFAFGETSLELWGFNTGADLLTSPYERVNSIDVGTGRGVYSHIPIDGGYAWLDERQRFVISDGRSFEVLSDPIAKAVASLGTVSDCWGFRRVLDGKDHLIWVFPTEKTAYAYERSTKRWSTERGFSDGEYRALTYGAYYYWPQRNLHLVGGNNGAGLCRFDTSTYTDLGNPISCEVMTGFDTPGGPVRKRSMRDMYVARRGVAAFGGAAQHFEVAHRDDLGSWSSWRKLSTGVQGDYEAVLGDWVGGVYRTRQRRLRWTGTQSFSLASAWHDYEVIGP